MTRRVGGWRAAGRGCCSLKSEGCTFYTGTLDTAKTLHTVCATCSVGVAVTKVKAAAAAAHVHIVHWFNLHLLEQLANHLQLLDMGC